MTYGKSHTRFRLAPKSMTLDDPEGPLRSYALRLKTRASFGAHHENLKEGRLYCQRRRCSPMTLDSDNIIFMRIFTGVPWKGASYNSGVIENVFFSLSDATYSAPYEMSPTLLYSII